MNYLGKMTSRHRLHQACVQRVHASLPGFLYFYCRGGFANAADAADAGLLLLISCIRRHDVAMLLEQLTDVVVPAQ